MAGGEEFTMKTVTVAIALSVILTSVAHGCITQDLPSQRFSLEGRATTIDGEHLYTEYLHHRNDGRGDILMVDYTDPGGTTFALKTVDYACNPTTPSFELKDMDAGTVEGVRWSESVIQAYQGSDSVQLEVPEGPIIVDAGFDNAIKLSWEKMMSGEKVAYKYLFARDQRFLKLRFHKSTPPDLPNQRFDDDIVFFKVGANNFIFRMLSSPIYVGYQRDTRELKYYYGPSNLPAMKKQKEVFITYKALNATS